MFIIEIHHYCHQSKIIYIYEQLIITLVTILFSTASQIIILYFAIKIFSRFLSFIAFTNFHFEGIVLSLYDRLHVTITIFAKIIFCWTGNNLLECQVGYHNME